MARTVLVLIMPNQLYQCGVVGIIAGLILVNIMSRNRPRNKSVGCIPRESTSPPPGFVAFLGSIERTPNGPTTFHPYGLSEPLSPNSSMGMFTSIYCSPVRPADASIHATFQLPPRTPILVSPEPLNGIDDIDDEYDDDDILASKKESSSSSSGYGSSNEHDRVSEPSGSDESARYWRSSYLNRRRSMSNLIEERSFEVDMTRVLSKNGYVNYETNVDTGEPIRMEIRGMSKPESVLQLARKFSEISAAQHKDMHKSMDNARSRSHPTTPIKNAPNSAIQPKHIGGIASLTNGAKMSAKPNMFKQMEKVGANPQQQQPVRVLNPNSIKDALLRWIQNRVQGYPNVNVTNFSSSWADGMAFCALIHRFAPNSFDFNQLDPANRRHNLELAFRVAEENGIFPLLEVDDMIMMGDRPDWKCVFTYVQSFYKQFRNHP